MYADYFGFRELPFNNTPDPRFFYSTPDHEEALASLIYAVRERKGFVLLTGEVGTGKTLVSRMMLRHFGTQIAFATINHAVPSASDLMESICSEFELQVKPGATTTQLVRTLHDFLLAQFSQNIPVVLVLDEAQNFLIEGFEQLRMIGNLEADDAKLLQIAIVGQPELQRMFLSPEFRQIRQRIFRSFHLPALSREATEAYIQHRLSVVTDTVPDIFDEDAIAAIYKHSRGLPRVINTICDNSLLSAYSADQRTIDGPFVKSVVSQMMIVNGPQHDGGEGHGPMPAQPSPYAALRQAGRITAAERGPDCWSNTARDQYPTDALAQQVDRMTLWAQRIDAQLRIRPPSVPFTAGLRSLNEESDVLGTTRSGPGGCVPARPDYGPHSEIDRVADRVAALERRFKDTAGGWAQARAAEASLRPLVQQTRSLVGRAEAASQDLERRDKQLRKLAATVREVVRDLGKLLGRAHEASTRTSLAERTAQATSDRLAGQTKRSRQLADQLAELVDRMMPRDTRDPPRTRTTTLGLDLMDSPEEAPDPARTHHVQNMLADARKSLSGLRSVARGFDVGRESPADTCGVSATTRLARQVESLLEIVEPGADTTVDDEVPVTG